MDVTMKKLAEASYLTADYAAQYRTILRYFYHQHGRMRDFIASFFKRAFMNDHIEKQLFLIYYFYDDY